jgi:single-stranded-DNA-specific exonuclease
MLEKLEVINMKITQIGNYTGDLISTTLENRGIEDLELYYNPSGEYDSNPQLLMNVEKGTQLYLSELNKGTKTGLVVDADMDGYASASVIYQYSKILQGDADITPFFHEGKAHGLTEHIMKQVYKSGVKFLIVPDAGSNDVEQIEALETNGIKVLVIDHHEVDKFTDKGVIVNNQLCDHTNKNLVGVGMVYKFLQFIDGQGIGELDKFLDLVAAGQIGDTSDISDPEIRNLVTKGLDNIQNKFFKEVIGEPQLGRKIAPKDLSFGLIPLINAVVRVGTLEERELIFEAMNDIGDDRIFPVIKKKKNPVTKKFDQVPFDFTVYQQAADLAAKCKNRQAALVKKLVAVLEDTVDNNHGVVIGKVPDEIDPQGVIGLVANKLVGKYDKPCLLLNEKEKGKWTGSGRGHEKTFPDFRAWCESTGVTDFAQGHANAFGIGVTEENLPKLFEAASGVEKNEANYEVDILTNKPDPGHAELIDKNQRLFGGSVKEPFIGIKNLVIPKRFISMKGSTLNLWSYGVSMVQFGSSPNFFAEVMNYPEENVTLDIVGFYGINDWGGSRKPQLIIKDIEIANNNNDEVTVDNIVF